MKPITTNLTAITFSVSNNTELEAVWLAYQKEKEKLDEHTTKVLLWLKDKIYKFSDIENWLSSECLCKKWEHKEVSGCTRKCGQYKYLLIQNRPVPSFIEGTNEEELLKELRKYIGILWYDLAVGVFEELSDYIAKQDKEYRKKYMPNLNLILFNSRNAPPLKELLDILGRKETESRIQNALEALEINQSSLSTL